MVKIADLVAAMRCCEHNSCAGCPYTERNSECIGEVMGAAADKIEELVDRCARYAEEIAALHKQRTWISASEYLPQAGKTVLCWYEYYRYGNFNCMYEDFGIGYFWNGHWMGEVSNGRDARVLAWMPLPTKPEEAKL